MRLTRDYLYDMVELVGKAVSTARAKKERAGPEWDIEEQLNLFMNRWALDRDPIEKAIREEAENEDNRWGLELGEWKDSAQDGIEGAIDDRENRETYSKYGSEKFEQRKAKRGYDQFGDWASCKLWKIQRQLSFKEIGVQDALKDLADLCCRMKGYISDGWATRLWAIIHAHSRG